METIIGKDLNKAIQILKEGELVSIPTETVYGLAGNAISEDTLLKIYKTKNRPNFDPLIIHVASVADIFNYVKVFPKAMQKLAAEFCPGPLTFVLPKNDIISDIATSGLEKVAIRIPDHPLTLELLNELPFPVAAPSANLFGRVSPTTASHVLKQLGGKISYILDGGSCNIGIESTIITCAEDKIMVLRVGGTSIEAMREVVDSIEFVMPDSEMAFMPGRFKSHYATTTPIYFGKFDDIASDYPNNKLGLITFSRLNKHIPETNQRILSTNLDLEEAAKNLFRMMHELDNLNLDIIIAEEFPDTGLGRAINDRLRRASVNH